MEFLANHHPLVVHFPIVLFILYFLFETFGILLKKEYFHTTAYIILSGGVVTSLLAVLTGNQAQMIAEYTLSRENIFVKNLINNHQQIATITVWYFFTLLVFRTYLLVKKKLSLSIKYVFILLALIGCCLIYATGNIGASLVYKHGIGTQLLRK